MTGLLGAGQSSLALALAGAIPASGTIVVNDVTRRVRSIRDAMRAGIAQPAGRSAAAGAFIDQSVVRNVTASSLRRLRTPLGLLSRRRIDTEAARWSDRLETRFASADDPVWTLSGGNQQRVVLSKCLATSPKILIMNGPTVGVDVGAKEAIHLTIRRLAEGGMAVLIVSDDLAELVENCDRVLVFRQGAVVDELAGQRLAEDELAAQLTVRH